MAGSAGESALQNLVRFCQTSELVSTRRGLGASRVSSDSQDHPWFASREDMLSQLAALRLGDSAGVSPALPQL
jgi:hypothetical protein